MSGVQGDKTNSMWWGLTDAAHPCGVELKVRRALAYVASRDVNTDPIDAEGWVCTFIHI